MKSALVLLFLAGSALLATAAPYLVYTGTATGGVTAGSGTSSVTVQYTVLTDLSDTSKFAVMEVSPKLGEYSIIARPSASPAADEADNNFFGGLMAANGKSGQGILNFADKYVSPTYGYTTVTEFRATGALTLSNVTLVPARKKPLVVKVKIDVVTQGTQTLAQSTQTFEPSAAITSGGTAFPKALSGGYILYVLNNFPGSLDQAAANGKISLSLNTALTTLANIGGGFTSGKDTAAIFPVNGSTITDYQKWLNSLESIQGYTLTDNLFRPAVEIVPGTGGGTFTLGEGTITITEPPPSSGN